MELKMRFNEDAANYDRYRPGYPKELLNAISRYAGIGAGCRVLEIGIGTGQATGHFLELGCQVDAVEIGESLCAYVSEKFRDEAGFHVFCGDFLDYAGAENSYDLIYCATAFHWLDAGIAHPKICSLLKEGGSLALFWNHPFVRRQDDPTNQASEAVYEALRPTNREFKELEMEDTENRKQELLNFGYTSVEVQLFRRTRTLNTEQYLGLLNTYSDHRALEPTLKERFETSMRQAITDVGGMINIYDTLDLYLAKKPHP